MTPSVLRRPDPPHHLRPLLPPRAPEFLGASPQIRALLERADRLARTDLPLLLHGESGTGKEVLARRIHARSARRDGPFVAENCAAISASLFESELFGHARGAFTGADRDRDGLFQAASGGTLLLDEIGDLAPGLQAKLLRAIESGRVRPLGAERERAVDVRLLTSTHRDLPELVARGAFREDLLHRLRGACLSIPPLRARPGDAVLLARAFLAELDRAHGTERGFAPGELDRIARRRWPGNARELRNAVQLAYHAQDGPLLRLDDPPAEVGPLVQRVATLAEIEREAILLALRECGGSRDDAARRLGISRSSIYERIRRHGLAAPRDAPHPP